MTRVKQFILGGLALFGLIAPSQAQSVWELRNPLTPVHTLNGVTWTGTQFVAVGANGTIITSPNGSNWTTRSSGTTNTLYGVTWSATHNLLVAVGASGTILVSSTGESWASRSTGGAALYTVGNNGGTFVAAGAGGAIYTSANGNTWSTQTFGGNSLNAVTWSNSRFVIVGSGATLLSSPDGTNWSSNNPQGSSVFTGITTAGGQFVVVGTGTSATSADGQSWTIRSVSGAGFMSVALGSTLVAVGTNGGVYTSSDGVSWTSGTSGVTNGLYSVAAGAGKFVAVGVGGIILNSANGTAWTRVSSLSVGLYATTASPTAQVAVGAGGSILSSTDHFTWTPRTSGTTASLNSVTWAGTRFVAVGDGGVVLTSRDGVAWTPQTSNFASNLSTVNWNGIRLVAAHNGGNTATLVSTDTGVTWANLTTSPTNGFDALASNGTLLVGVGANGLIRNTTTGTAGWTQRANGLANGNRLYGVTFTGTRFVAVGGGGTILASTDGTFNSAWTSQTSGVTTSLRAVTWTGTQAVAMGDNGVVLTSPNGLDWTPRSSGTSQTLYGAGWSGSYVMAVGNTGTVLVSSPAAVPLVPELNTPTAGTTGLPVNPTFSWKSSSGATYYQIQVATSSGFGAGTVVVNDSGVAPTPGAGGILSHTTGPLTPGTQYHWRVRAGGPTGLSAYTASFSFTVIGAAQSAPTLSTPANTATGVSLSGSLVWNAYPNASSYHVQLGTDPNFATWLLNDSTVAGTSTSRFLPSTIESNTLYYWRVRAKVPEGTTAFSTRWSFTTIPPLPATPTLNSPANNAFVNPPNATLSWSTVATATAYHVQLATDSLFGAGTLLLDDTAVTATSRTQSGLSANGQYYWRVRAKNAGGYSAYSAFRRFHSSSVLPSAAALISPSNGQTGISVYGSTFTWSSASNAVRYRLQVASDTDFTVRVLDTTVSALSFSSSTLLANTTQYYWRVTTVNPLGSTNSARWSFRSGEAHTAPPPAPVPLAPTLYSTGISPVSVTFTWQASATAIAYRIEVSTDPAFPSTVFKDTAVATTFKTFTGLTGATAYYWRVAAKNQVGWSANSDIFTFTTAATVPAAPVLDAPAQFALGTPVTPRLSWFRSHSATSYTLQVSLASSFSTFVRNDILTDTAMTLPELANNTEYYWRVNARNTAGTSDFSSPRRFTTGTLPVPGTPVLASPAQFAQEVPLSPLLAWESASDASTYHVQVATEATFSAPVVNDSGITELTRTVAGPLARSTEYYWRVRGKNSGGVGAFSSARRFTTTVNTALLPGRQAFQRLSTGDTDGLRFGLSVREKVMIRFFDTQGRQVAKSVDAFFDPGYHVLALPPELKGSFFLLEFRAGNFHRTLKIHP